MRVLVCGPRDYEDRLKMTMILDELDYDRTFTTLIHGDARGADKMAGAWATRRGIMVEPYPADWKHFGSAAGPIRNREMLVVGLPDLVVGVCVTELANSTGTKDMINQAKWAKVETIVIEI